MKIRLARFDDFESIFDLIGKCTPYLVQHTEFTYVLLFRYFPDFCRVLTSNDQIVGYVGGFTATPKSSSSYLWQLGILPEYQGKGLASQLLSDFVEQARLHNCNRIEFSIEPDNENSLKAFQAYADSENIVMEKIDELSYLKPKAANKTIEIFYRYSL